MRTSLLRLAGLAGAALTLALAAAPSAGAFAGRDGAVVYGWFSYLEDNLEPHALTFEQYAIRAVSPRGGTPATLRGCTKQLGKPAIGDCSVRYRDPAVSPDGTRVAFATGASLALMDIDGGGFRLLPAHSASDRDPAFSPTGTRLAFSASTHSSWPRAVWVSDLFGRHARRITEGTSPAWSSRNWIAFLRDGGVYRIRPDGRGLRRLVADEECTGVAWSPHGTRLAFVCRDGLFVVGGDGRHLRELPTSPVSSAPPPLSPVAVAWSPSGTRLAVVPFDGGVTTMRVDGSHVRDLIPGTYSSQGALGAAGVDWQPLR